MTSLVAAMAAAAGRRVLAGGNLGEPALDLLEQPVPDLYVLELSSFQLETTYSLELEAAVVLNVTADHMDRYASIAAYARAKERIFAQARRPSVLNADDPLVAAMRPAAGASGGATRSRLVTFPPSARCRFHAADVEAHETLAGAPRRAAARHRAHEDHRPAQCGATPWRLSRSERRPACELPAMLAALEAFPGLKHRSAWIADIARRALHR